MTDAETRPTLSSALAYKDPKAAFLWLEQAFGFEPSMVILDADDNLAHSEMRFGDGLIMVGNEWSDDHKSPLSLGGKNTQSVHLQLPPAQEGDLDEHCERARKAGARILQEPATPSFMGIEPTALLILKATSGRLDRLSRS